MENYKVRVNNEDESKRVQELFFELGASLGNGDKHAVLVPNIMGLAVIDGLINFVFNDVVFADIGQCKEINLAELCDLVVLKRCDVGDATHEDIGIKYYVTSKGDLYQFYDGKWGLFIGCKSPTFTRIKKSNAMKEYLNEKYELIAAPDEVNKSSKLKSVSDTLKERQQQYGCFEDVAHVTQEILKVLRSTGGYDRMPPPHKEALHMIASKMARIVNGDCGHKDNWHNISGYANLIEDLVEPDWDDTPF